MNYMQSVFSVLLKCYRWSCYIEWLQCDWYFLCKFCEEFINFLLSKCFHNLILMAYNTMSSLWCNSYVLFCMCMSARVYAYMCSYICIHVYVHVHVETKAWCLSFLLCVLSQGLLLELSILCIDLRSLTST